MNRRLFAIFLSAIVVMTGLFSATSVAAEQSHPSYGCYRIIQSEVNGSTVKVESDAFATAGALLIDRTYYFGDGTRTTTNDGYGAPAMHTYREAGDYSISVVFRFNVNGQEKTVSGDMCRTTFTADSSHTDPVYSCDSLSVQPTKENRTVQYQIRYTAHSGATLVSITYNYGDGSSGTFTAASGTIVRHRFEESRVYATTATLNFTVTDGGQTYETKANCSVTLAVG